MQFEVLIFEISVHGLLKGKFQLIIIGENNFRTISMVSEGHAEMEIFFFFQFSTHDWVPQLSQNNGKFKRERGIGPFKHDHILPFTLMLRNYKINNLKDLRARLHQYDFLRYPAHVCTLETFSWCLFVRKSWFDFVCEPHFAVSSDFTRPFAKSCK